MALNQDQISQLNTANERITQGIGSATDQANLDYAIKNQGYKAPSLTVNNQSNNNSLAGAVSGFNTSAGPTPFQQGTGIEGYDAALAAEKAAKTTPTDPNSWITDWMKNAFGEQKPADQIAAPDLTSFKDQMVKDRDSRLASLDAQYATNLATVRTNNQNLGNSLKARLIKLGVSPSDSAWSNAEAGQSQRDKASEATLYSEYLNNKSKIESDSNKSLSDMAMKEIEMKFNTSVENVKNKLATQAQGIDLYNIFSQRDQSEKDRETKAYGDLLQYQGTMAGLAQKQQEAISKTFIDNAQKGLYNVSDKNVLAMLTKMEKESPYLTGLTNIAASGLTDRLDQKAMDALNKEKVQWDIKNIQSTISDRAKSGSSTSTAAKKKLDILNQYAGYIDQQLHTSVDANGNYKSSNQVRPGGLTTAEYQQARKSAVLEGVSGTDFDEAFSSAIGSSNRYTPAPDTGSGSYFDNVTGKVVSIKSVI